MTIALVGSLSSGPTTWSVVAGSLPPGLTLLSPRPGTTTMITGNPTHTGTFNFTIKGQAATRSYQITITTQGPPDELLCDAAGDFLISGTYVLPDAIIGEPYQALLPTSHAAGGTLGVVSGSLPPGLSLPATFTGSGDTISGTPTDPDPGHAGHVHLHHAAHRLLRLPGHPAVHPSNPAAASDHHHDAGRNRWRAVQQ